MVFCILSQLREAYTTTASKWPKFRGELGSGVWPFSSRYSNATAPTDVFGRVVYGEGPEAKPEKLAPSGLWTVELALDLAGWKPALLDGGTGGLL